MKKSTILILVVVFTLFTITAGWAMDMSHGDMNASGMDHSGHVGLKIHESMQNGYHLAYHLIDMKEKMKDMQGMQMNDMPMDVTHHLMVYITSPEGQTLQSAKVGYLVKNPDGSSQKLMTMGMKGGFGADASFKDKGNYTIKTKAVNGDATLVDEFVYEVK